MSTPLREALHRRLLAVPFDPAHLAPDELRARLEILLRDEAPLVTDAAAASVVDAVVADVEGLGPLQALLADPAISEVMVNGPGRVFVERNGGLEAVPCDRRSKEHALPRAPSLRRAAGSRRARRSEHAPAARCR